MNAHPFVRPGQVAPHLPAPDNCMVCGLPEAAHGTKTISVPGGAELAARRTAAAAVVADYHRALKAANDAREITWSYWAQRLALAVDSLLGEAGPLEQIGAQAALRQMEQIRLVLDAFDWEHDDRQYALEQIDDILRGDR